MFSLKSFETFEKQEIVSNLNTLYIHATFVLFISSNEWKLSKQSLPFIISTCRILTSIKLHFQQYILTIKNGVLKFISRYQNP